MEPRGVELKATRTPGLRIVSLFAGAGGLDIAACSSGRVISLVSTDSHSIFLSTTERNIPRHFPSVKHRSIGSDARDLKGSELLEAAGGSVDLVIGGPPCDDFTKTGLRRGFDGAKGPLIYEFVRLVDELKPRFFVFENVPNLAVQFADEFSHFTAYFKEAGYQVRWEILSANDYGAPTMRKRIFMVGASSQADIDSYRFPEPTHAPGRSFPTLFDESSELKPAVLVRDVLGDLPDRIYGSDAPSPFLNHTGRFHRPETIEKMKRVPAGVDTRQSFRYRAPWDGLCRSLTAGLDESTKSYLHPAFHREMSVREYARIHCFPDTWFFEGTHHNGIKQVANSVPIPLGTAVMREVHRLFGTEFDS